MDDTIQILRRIFDHRYGTEVSLYLRIQPVDLRLQTIDRSLHTGLQTDPLPLDLQVLPHLNGLDQFVERRMQVVYDRPQLTYEELLLPGIGTRFYKIYQHRNVY